MFENWTTGTKKNVMLQPLTWTNIKNKKKNNINKKQTQEKKENEKARN